MTNFKAGDRVEFVDDYGIDGQYAKKGTRATIKEVRAYSNDAIADFEEDIEAANTTRLKLLVEESSFKHGDRVTVKGYNPGGVYEGWTGTVDGKYKGTGQFVTVDFEGQTFGQGTFHKKFIVPAAPEFPREASFEDIQVGDTIRRTRIGNGATEVREGVVGNKSGVYALTEDDCYILAYNSDSDPAKAGVTLEILARPEPTPDFKVGDYVRVNSKAVTETWEGAEGTVAAVIYSGHNAEIVITKNPPSEYKIGSVVTLPAHKFDVIEAPKRTAATEPIGAQFTAVGAGGKRLLTKVGRGTWTNYFFNSGNLYGVDNAKAQRAFDTGKGEWVNID